MLLTLFTGCRKFEDYNTIIEVVLPDACKSCNLYYQYTFEMGDGSDKFSSGEALKFNMSVSDGEVQEIEIDWEEEIVTPDYDTQPFNFFLDNKAIENAYYYEEEADYSSGEIHLKPGKVYRWDVEAGTFEKTGETTDRKGGGGSGGSGGGGSACYHGTFSRDNGSAKDDTWTLNSNGTGSAFFADVNGICEGANFRFDYTLSGDQLTISYTSAKVCGEDQPLPDDETINFSCDDSGIHVGSDFYER